MSVRPTLAQTGCLAPRESDALAVTEARARILEHLAPVAGTLRLSVRQALGRALARDVICPVNVPAHTNSAMDGYAVRSEDLPAGAPATLRVIGTAYAGHPFADPVQGGECVRIMTGAALPAGTDTVVMQEQAVAEADGRVRLEGSHRRGQNVRRAGEDLAAGRPALRAGQRLMPAHLGLLASLGVAEATVHRPPTVAFFSTGDELRSIGEPLGDGQIYDSNRYTLYGMLTRLGVDVMDMGVVRDRPQALREAFTDAAAHADALITTGGVSVGESDFVRQILDERGRVQFWKIAMKPGRPFAFGRLGDCAFFGLPGNPVAAMVTFYQFVQPALIHMAGDSDPLPVTVQVPCAERLTKKPGRTEFRRGILEAGPGGALTVRSSGQQGSGILSSMSRANCFLVLPAESETFAAGSPVEVQPFEGLV